MSAPLQKQLQALPSYFGGKRRHLAWIGSTLAKALPTHAWPQATFIDLFMGGGAVSIWAKAQGFKQVIANDISTRSEILANAFLLNHRIQLSRADALWLSQPLPQPPGFIESYYSPSVYSTRHAQALDQGFYWAKQHPNPVKQALLLVLMWHLANDFVAFATSLGTSNRPFAEALDGLRSWDELNAKRYTDGSLKRLCKPTWSELETKRAIINRGILGGSPTTFHQSDALSLLPTLQGDILYLDPPYAGTLSYERSNEVLDALLTSQISSEKKPISPFSQGLDALEALLTKASHIPIWLLSYGNQETTLEDLEELIRVYAKDRTVLGFSKHYRHLSHVSKNENNQELLILAYPSGGHLL